MVDVANKDTGTKIHRVLNMLGLPLGIAMMCDAWKFPPSAKELENNPRLANGDKNLKRENGKRQLLRQELNTYGNNENQLSLLNPEAREVIDNEVNDIEDAKIRRRSTSSSQKSVVDFNAESAVIPETKVLVFVAPVINGNQEYNVTWRYILPLYCAMNAILYYGHHHGEEGEMTMTKEEEAHQPFFWSYFFATYAYGISQYLAIDQIQHFLFLVGSLLFVVLGCWYIVAAVVLYGGAFGVNGATYGDTAADYGIILLVISTVAVMAYLWFEKYLNK
jgi:hypothetical protein